MSFSADWLALREPADHAARNADVLAAVAAHFSGRTRVHVTDLACGAGSTIRALTPVLPAADAWRLVDNDPRLLAEARRLSGRFIAGTAEVDLDRDLADAFGATCDLGSTSAFLDLVGADWLGRFVAAVAARRLPVYAALSYDGRARLDPDDHFDVVVIDAQNRHQRTDKGLGPALGPTAAEATVAAFEAAGYRVVQGTSDWVLGPGSRAMQAEILRGWAGAAHELGDVPAREIDAWLTRRLVKLDSGAGMMVGHVDVFAVPG